LGLGVLVVVAGVAVVVWLLATGTRPRSTATQSNRQRTLLVAVQQPSGPAAATALLATNPHGGGVEVLIPAQVVTIVPGYGQLQLGHALTLPDGPAVLRTSVSDLMQVNVDGSWVLTSNQLAVLVNRLGGVTADVDTQVVRRTPGGGGVVLLSPGNQRLSGGDAAYYATYRASGEQPLSMLPRLQAVLDGVLTDLGATPHAAQLLSGIGTSSETSASLAHLLVAMAKGQRSGNVVYQTLPVVPSGSGTYLVNNTELRTFVRTDLAGALLRGGFGQHNLVFVENGLGTPGLGATTYQPLEKAGFQFVGSGNAAHFGYRRSLVLVFQDTLAAARLGDRVAAALGLPAADVRYSAQGQTIADVVVVLGGDYHSSGP
jgi:hypothetical protein